MKKTLWLAAICCLMLHSTVSAQPGAANLEPFYRSRSGSNVGGGYGYAGMPYVGMPIYDPYTSSFGYASYPVYWWLDPFYQSGYYTWLTGYPPPIIAGNWYPTVPFYIPMNMNRPIMVNPKPNADKPAPPKLDKMDNPNDAKPDAFDKKESMARALRLGNAEFMKGSYNQALRYYEQASRENPLDGQPWFYQGQALFALGQYHKAVTALHRGLKWQPQWPASAFQVRALYGENNKLFTQQLALLASAVDKNPNDDGLLFLLGYQLWFDGEKEKAALVLKRASSLMVDTSAIDGFLKAQPSK